MAADSGHKEIVEILLENGVDVSSRSNVRFVPYFFAY